MPTTGSVSESTASSGSGDGGGLGLAVGCVAVALLLIGAGVWWRRRQRLQATKLFGGGKAPATANPAFRGVAPRGTEPRQAPPSLMPLTRIGPQGRAEDDSGAAGPEGYLDIVSEHADASRRAGDDEHGLSGSAIYAPYTGNDADAPAASGKAQPIYSAVNKGGGRSMRVPSTYEEPKVSGPLHRTSGFGNTFVILAALSWMCGSGHA